MLDLRYGLLAFLVAMTVSAQAKPNTALAPCGSEFCSDELGDDARRLNDAYLSDATTDAERLKMRSLVASHTANGVIDWSNSATEYFGWRATTRQYLQPRPGKADPPTNPAEAIRRAEAEDNADQRAFREAGEAAVRARLIDPDSAQFQWPFKFVEGYWKPFLAKRVTGYVTCGYVNARNLMGGYAGRTAFAVVMSAQKIPLLVDMDSGANKYSWVETQCDKASASLLPAAPFEESASNNAAQSGSIADELEKLANLRDRGVLSQPEFDAQKAKLLGGR